MDYIEYGPAARYAGGTTHPDALAEPGGQSLPRGRKYPLFSLTKKKKIQ